MIIQNTNRQPSIGPASSRLSDPIASRGNTSFEAQLSAALTESLEKLGVGSGEVNITIRNPSATTRQILVTYSLAGSSSVAPATATPASTAASPTTTPAVGNPFLGTRSTEPPPPAEAATERMDWAPYSGPRDIRDGISAGGGKTTSSGAPLIIENETDTKNQYGYVGPATKNPYFTNPSNPPREGYVKGYDNWFANPMLLGGPNGPVPANKIYYANEEGAQEALRIVNLFASGGKIVQSYWRSGPYSIDKPRFEIELPSGRKLNAGGILATYYTQGYGAGISSDETIRREIQLA